MNLIKPSQKSVLVKTFRKALRETGSSISSFGKLGYVNKGKKRITFLNRTCSNCEKEFNNIYKGEKCPYCEQWFCCKCLAIPERVLNDWDYEEYRWHRRYEKACPTCKNYKGKIITPDELFNQVDDIIDIRDVLGNVYLELLDYKSWYKPPYAKDPDYNPRIYFAITDKDGARLTTLNFKVSGRKKPKRFKIPFRMVFEDIFSGYNDR